MVLREWHARGLVKGGALHFFLAGAAYALLGIAVAQTIFPDNIGIVSVFFTSIALIPAINRLFALTELLEGREREVKGKTASFTELEVHGREVSLRSLYEDNQKLFKAYLFSFFGIFLVFALLTLYLPGDQANHLFGEQSAFGPGGGNPAQQNQAGQAVNPGDFFWSVLRNNLGVLVVAFLIALLFEYGTTFIVAWNASVWGHVFAAQAKNIVYVSGLSPGTQFLLILLSVLPHTVAEAGVYFLGAMAGGIMNKALAKERLFGERFNQIARHVGLTLLAALALLFVAAFLEDVVPRMMLG